jgi:2-polyprenyl-3-methyl-5-hydroxy-6-metoxy-1,4-benzoquinol methylase
MSALAWHEDDSYWASVYNFFFSEKAFRQAELNVPKLIQLSGRVAGKLLDLGCGPGRYAVPLAKLGFQVTGLDRTQLLLNRGREYASTQAVQVEWVNDDMRRFVRPDTYDVVVSMFTSFGYFEDINENRAVLENVFKSLIPGGVLLMDLAGKEIVARVFQPAGVNALPNGDLFIEERQIVEDWQKAQNKITTIVQGQIRVTPIRLWIFSAAELKRLLLDAGFTKVQVYGNLEGAPYGPDATRLIAVAEK